MGHGSPTNMIATIQNGIWTIEDVTPNWIRKAFQHEDCLATVLWQKKSSSTLFGSSQTSIGDELPLDIFGPYRPPDIRGHRYFTLVVNANTLYWHVFLNKTKTELLTYLTSLVGDYLNMVGLFKKFDTMLTVSKILVRLWHIYLQSIVVKPAVEHQNQNQNQNPVERSIQTLFKFVNSILVDQSHLLHAWWGYALLFHVSIINCTPNSRTDGYVSQQLYTD